MKGWPMLEGTGLWGNLFDVGLLDFVDTGQDVWDAPTAERPSQSLREGFERLNKAAFDSS